MLERAVNSVLAETRVPINLFIYDNGSTDETPTYLKGLSKKDFRVRHSRLEKNIGTYAGFTRALEVIGTEYFVMLSDDDWLLPNFLYDAYYLLAKHPRAKAAVFRAEGRSDADEMLVSYPSASLTGERQHKGFTSPKDTIRLFAAHGHYFWSSIVWNTELIQELSHPYFHVGMPSDVDFQFQLFAKHPVVLSPNMGAVFRHHAGQYSQKYDVREIPSFVKLISRMNTAIATFFDDAEYQNITAKIADRYRSVWRIPTAVELSRDERLNLACMAVLGLNDWEVAANLTKENLESKAASDSSYLEDLLSRGIESPNERPEVIRQMKLNVHASQSKEHK